MRRHPSLEEVAEEVVTLAEAALPKVRVRPVVPYAPRGHTVSWQLVHALAGLASHAAWRAEILRSWYAEMVEGLKAGKPILEIVNEIAASYEKLTGETLAQTKGHIPKAVGKLEQLFGIRVE